MYLNSFVESDGCARTTIVLLLLTTIGCMSYTWGYYEVGWHRPRRERGAAGTKAVRGTLTAIPPLTPAGDSQCAKQPDAGQAA